MFWWKNSGLLTVDHRELNFLLPAHCSPRPFPKKKRKRNDKGPGRIPYSRCMICKIKIRATKGLRYFYVLSINHFALPSVTPPQAHSHSSFCTEKQLLEVHFFIINRSIKTAPSWSWFLNNSLQSPTSSGSILSLY